MDTGRRTYKLQEPSLAELGVLYKPWAPTMCCGDVDAGVALGHQRLHHPTTAPHRTALRPDAHTSVPLTTSPFTHPSIPLVRAPAPCLAFWLQRQDAVEQAGMVVVVSFRLPYVNPFGDDENRG